MPPDFYKIDLREQSKPRAEKILFWISTALLFFLCSFTPERFAVNGPLNLEQNLLAPLKGLLFFASSIFLFWEIFGAGPRGLLGRIGSNLACRLKTALALFAALALLAFPFAPPWGLSGMGIGYGLVSLDPFAQPASWAHRRLLLVALAHWLGFRGPFLFYIFFLTVVFLLIFMSVCFFEEKSKEWGLDARKKPWLSFFCLLSLCTSSGVLFHFQYVGYPEAALLVLLLFAYLAAFTEYGFLALVAAAMATHEIAVFLLLPVLLFSVPFKTQVKGVAVIGLFFLFWALSFRLDLSQAVASQVQVDGRSGFGNLLHRFDLGLLGVFFAYKFLWIGFAALTAALWKKKELRRFLLASFCMIAFPLAMIVLTVDTSRLMGLGFIGALALLICFLRKTEAHAAWRKAGLALLGLNLLLPSYYVGTTSGFQVRPGLYSKIPVYQILKTAMGKKRNGRIF